MPVLSRSFVKCLALSLAALIAGCDRGAEDSAQPEATLSGSDAVLSGEFDTSQAGSLMPAIVLTDPAGKELNTGALQGQPVLVNLWATWCAPCVVEMPMLDELAQDYAGRMRVVTISQDARGTEVVAPFFAQNSFDNLPSWLDPDAEFGQALGNGGLPVTVLYDASGREVWRVTGGYDWTSDAAKTRIDEAMGKS